MSRARAYLVHSMLFWVTPDPSPESDRIVTRADIVARDMAESAGIERTKTWAQELDSIAVMWEKRLAPIAYAILIDSLES